ncbi:MAG: hypothetical protein KDB22_30115, partial [Planctomycetales bacterium]|nr:hypothetical protein [Planctomycetales bacterium]
MTKQMKVSKQPNDQKGSTSHGQQALHRISQCIVAGLVCVVLYSLQSWRSSFCSVAFSGLLLSGASLLIGGGLGFLFGIPRTLQPDDTDGSNTSQETVEYKANTNLEQISDWLTKMLVGVGLTQLPNLLSQLKQVSLSISPSLGTSASAPVAAASILVYFGIAGFLLGFLWTRLYLASAFREVDIGWILSRVDAADKKIDEFQKQAEADVLALNLVAKQLAPDPEAAMVPQHELNAAVSAASQSVRAQIFNQAWRLRVDNWRDDKPLMERCIPVFEALIASDLGKQFHQNHGQLGYALKDKQQPDWKAAEERLVTAIKRRGPVKDNGHGFYEFNLAICRIMLDEDSLAGKPSDDKAQNVVLKLIEDSILDG